MKEEHLFWSFLTLQRISHEHKLALENLDFALRNLKNRLYHLHIVVSDKPAREHFYLEFDILIPLKSCILNFMTKVELMTLEPFDSDSLFLFTFLPMGSRCKKLKALYFKKSKPSSFLDLNPTISRGFKLFIFESYDIMESRMES